MKRIAFAAATATCAAFTLACHAAPEFSGQLRPEWTDNAANPNGPLAQASSGATIETELRASGHGLTFVGTLQEQRLEHDRLRSHGWVNELYGSTEAMSWQFSAGKKIVGWDVGYGFRPNDVVEQEARRTLLPVTAEGRPLLMAEHFDAATAWSVVLVNPTKPHDEPGATEPALAARVYRRDGAIDWHGFARIGAHTGPSVGGAFAWVAGESLELHASTRWLAHADTLTSSAPSTQSPTPLLAANPWQAERTGATAQALVGATWTNADQLSLLAEAWWDGTALSDAQWDDWTARNRNLAAQAGGPVPPSVIAGNLAWQASAFTAAANQRRMNLFARLSWQHEKWQPALDVLWTPADGGRVVTGGIGWQGDRVRIDGGARWYGGPTDAVLAQLPNRRVVYLAATWSF